MMEAVRGAIGALCVLTVLCAALETVMPEGTVKKYAKFIFALAAMAVMLSPVFQLMQWMAGKGT